MGWGFGAAIDYSALAAGELRALLEKARSGASRADEEYQKSLGVTSWTQEDRPGQLARTGVLADALGVHAEVWEELLGRIAPKRSVER